MIPSPEAGSAGSGSHVTGLPLAEQRECPTHRGLWGFPGWE